MSNLFIIRRNVANNFPALKEKNFRYFWVGQCVSLLGTWIQRTAQHITNFFTSGTILFTFSMAESTFLSFENLFMFFKAYNIEFISSNVKIDD